MMADRDIELEMHRKPAPQITIQIVTWNSAHVISACLDSLASQSRSDFDVVIVDNASSDRGGEMVENWLASAPCGGQLIRADSNLGFSGGHNRALSTHRSPWVLLLNPDASLPNGFVQTALDLIEQAESEIGTFAPRILLEDGRIDSTGLFVDRFRRAFDRGQQCSAEGSYVEEEDVFGCTGAVALHRRAMLHDIALDGMVMDELIFAYYDDLDLAWRAQLRGWRCRYSPDLVAVHRRMGRNAVRPSGGQLSRASDQRLAIRNRFLVLIRCEQLRDVLVALPRLVPYEVARLVYIAFRLPGCLGAYVDLMRAWPAAWRARQQIQARAQADRLRQQPFFPSSDARQPDRRASR